MPSSLLSITPRICFFACRPLAWIHEKKDLPNSLSPFLNVRCKWDNLWRPSRLFIQVSSIFFIYMFLHIFFIQYFPSKYSIHLGVCRLLENTIPFSSHTFMQSHSLFTFDNGCLLSMNRHRLSRWFEASYLSMVATPISSFH
jgi:hypothetical protein